jgi:hypothetical protein
MRYSIGMNSARLIPLSVLAVLTFSTTAVTKLSPQQKDPGAARHDDSRQNEPNNPPIAVHPMPDKDIALQTSAPEKREGCMNRDTAKTDCWTRISNLVMAFGTLALAVIGAIAAYAALRTLRTIASQTVAAEVAARAATETAAATLKNAEALMNSERAWILVTMDATGPKLSADNRWLWEDGMPLSIDDVLKNRHHKPQRIRYTLRNYGRSPGWLISHRGYAQIVPTINGLPSSPDYSRTASFLGERSNLLYEPGKDRGTAVSIPSAELDPVANRESFLYVYGIIKYKDVWNGIHETGFCFYWHVPGPGDPDPQGWYAEGPEGYSYQT